MNGRIFKGAGLTGALLLTSGCASFDGMPEPVISTADAIKAVDKNYRFESVISQMSSMDEASRRVYRNRVVTSYLVAMDARYFDFRRNLSRNVKGGNIGSDLLLLGLTGSAAIWDKAASELSAVATAVAGGRASINRELYFEKTLPALITLMDAERLSVRTDILYGLAQAETEYTIEEAFSDLTRYQSSASLDNAIQKASEAASNESAKARRDYSTAVQLCAVTDELSTARRDVGRDLAQAAVDSNPDAQKRLAQAAVAAGMIDAQPAKEGSTERSMQIQKIGDFLRNVCTTEGLDTFKAAIDSQPLAEGS